MSLGLFNCRLIQPAGDQLFFSSLDSPHGASSGKLCLVPWRRILLGPDQRAQNAFVVPSQKDFVLVFRRGVSPVRCKRGSLLFDSPRISRRSPTPTHKFCYRSFDDYRAKSADRKSGRLEKFTLTATAGNPLLRLDCSSWRAYRALPLACEVSDTCTNVPIESIRIL